MDTYRSEGRTQTRDSTAATGFLGRSERRTLGPRGRVVISTEEFPPLK